MRQDTIHWLSKEKWGFQEKEGEYFSGRKEKRNDIFLTCGRSSFFFVKAENIEKLCPPSILKKEVTLRQKSGRIEAEKRVIKSRFCYPNLFLKFLRTIPHPFCENIGESFRNSMIEELGIYSGPGGAS
ncbi:MAG: hypothetical protein H0U76_04040 [Ktedonobacteraceae bacterium]|nr:hypothetical protein [Ktedonobacteraceae bacterium]